MVKAMQRSVKTTDPISVKKSSAVAGFTLIELMVTLAIMAIITMVAYPGYQQSIRKTRRSDGISAALTIQAAQEKFRAGCTVYASSFAAANNCNTPASTPAVYALDAATGSPDGFYVMSLSNLASTTGNAYVITATAQGAQAADTGCTAMTITFNATNPNGLKQPATCWP